MTTLRDGVLIKLFETPDARRVVDKNVVCKLTQKNQIVYARTTTASAGILDPLCIADASVA